jgi:RNA polymerase sigma-70 factor (ECF subfamily)
MVFQTTHWSEVLAARERDGTAGKEALSNLCSTYWYPLYAFIRREGFDQHEAEDLTQDFFARLLGRDFLANVSPAGGKFRSFLLASLRNFLVNERERASAKRRGGGQCILSLDAGEGETRFMLEPPDHSTPEVLFEKQWALTLLQQTAKALQAEYAAKNKADVFEDLKGFLPTGEQGESRAELAARRGISAGAVDVAIHRLRQRFGALLREQVAQTVSSEDEVDEEIDYLMSVLGT